jgi:hypothetical protein
MTKVSGCVLCLCALLTTVAMADKLQNAGFEFEFGLREDSNMWGDYGDVFGEAYQVIAGRANYVKKAHAGDRVLLINVPPGTWNGAWQQIPIEGNQPYYFKGFYLIKDGDLPPSCATFLKVEFYDGSDQLIESLEGDKLRMDTKGKWVQAVVNGQTPAGTQSARFVVIAGDNAGNEALVDRIFWDDVDVTD